MHSKDREENTVGLGLGRDRGLVRDATYRGWNFGTGSARMH